MAHEDAHRREAERGTSRRFIVLACSAPAILGPARETGETLCARAHLTPPASNHRLMVEWSEVQVEERSRSTPRRRYSTPLHCTAVPLPLAPRRASTPPRCSTPPRHATPARAVPFVHRAVDDAVAAQRTKSRGSPMATPNSGGGIQRGAGHEH